MAQNVAESVVAFLLGYIVTRKWRRAESRYVWIPVVVWFAQRSVAFWFENRDLGVLHGYHSIFWEMSGVGCSSDRGACIDWIVYTLPLLRGVFYSAGAYGFRYLAEYEPRLVEFVTRRQ